MRTICKNIQTPQGLQGGNFSNPMQVCNPMIIDTFDMI